MKVLGLKHINLKKLCKEGIESGKDFYIDDRCNYVKDLHNDVIKEERSIFHWRFYVSPSEKNFIQKLYSCQCGQMTGRDKLGVECAVCQEAVTKRDFDIRTRGWISTGEYHFLTVIGMMKLKKLIGDTKLRKLLKHDLEGFGIIDLREQWKDLILKHGKKSHGRLYREMLSVEIDEIFTNTIPVISSRLRPMVNVWNMGVNDISLHGLNNPYSGICTSVNRLLNEVYVPRWTEDRCAEIQMKIEEIGKIAIHTVGEGKKKLMRGHLLSMRLPYTGRLPIIPINKEWVLANMEEGCRTDIARVYYKGVLSVFKLEIREILKEREVPLPKIQKMMSLDNEATDEEFELIRECLDELKRRKRAFALINREPVIDFPSITSLEIVDITREKVLEVPLALLDKLRADFDGDILTIGYVPGGISYEVHKAMSPISYEMSYYGKEGKVKLKNDFQILMKKYLDDEVA